MSEKITVDSSDLRSPFPAFTGNFIVSGTPRERKFDKGWVYNFSVYWQNWTKDGYTGANYKNCSIFVNSEDELNKLKELIHGKQDGQPGSRIHIVEGIPKQRTFTDKNGVERTEEEVQVRKFFPYHLNKELKPWEKKGGSPGSGASTSDGIKNFGSTGEGEKLF